MEKSPYDEVEKNSVWKRKWKKASMKWKKAHMKWKKACFWNFNIIIIIIIIFSIAPFFS